MHYEFIFDIQKGLTIFMNYSMIFQKQISHIFEKNGKNIQFTIQNDTSKDKNVIILLENQEVFSFTNKNIQFDQVFIRSSMNHQVFQIRNNNCKEDISNEVVNNKDDNKDMKLKKISKKYFMYDTHKKEIDIYYKYNYLEHYVKNIEIQDYFDYLT